MRSSVAKFWNTRTGSAELRTVTALVRRMRLVRAAAPPRKTACSISSIRCRKRSDSLSARLESVCAAAKLSMPISTHRLRHLVLFTAGHHRPLVGVVCELGDTRQLPIHVRPRKAHDVGAIFTYERTVHHEGTALALAGVQYDPRTVVAANDTR